MLGKIIASEATAGEIVGKGAGKGIGCDLSKWNGDVDFRKLAPAVDFVIIRATNSLKTVDPFFLLNAKGCIDNGIPWGAYHFAGFTADPKAQADRFLSIVEKATGKPSMPLVLDVETNSATLPISGGQLEGLCSSFLTSLEAKGYDTALYMSPGFSWFFPKSHKLGNIKVWLADYSGKLNPANGWPKPYMHQYTDKGQLPGVKTAVDLNRIL